jgi:hypothetical protein
MKLARDHATFAVVPKLDERVGVSHRQLTGYLPWSLLRNRIGHQRVTAPHLSQTTVSEGQALLEEPARHGNYCLRHRKVLA